MVHATGRATTAPAQESRGPRSRNWRPPSIPGSVPRDREGSAPDPGPAVAGLPGTVRARGRSADATRPGARQRPWYSILE
jgi:hypothetical protein